jgi:hypothetical protein
MDWLHCRLLALEPPLTYARQIGELLALAPDGGALSNQSAIWTFLDTRTAVMAHVTLPQLHAGLSYWPAHYWPDEETRALWLESTARLMADGAALSLFVRNACSSGGPLAERGRALLALVAPLDEFNHTLANVAEETFWHLGDHLYSLKVGAL